MSQFKPITFSKEYIDQYWQGPSNMFARYATYLRRAFALLNEAKYYLMAILGSAYFSNIHLDIKWVITGGVTAIPLLVLLGRWDLYKLAKATEFITNLKGSITGYGMYNMQVRIVEQNDKIIELLKSLNEEV